MQSRRDYTKGGAVLGLTVLVAVLLVSAPPSHAIDGRDFAGLFRVDDITDIGGGQVRVSLTAQVFNYSGADVFNASVTLQDSINLGADFGAYSGTVSILADEAANLSSTFSISQDEFSRWQQGGAPSLRIDYPDVNGDPVRRQIELAPGPIGE